MRKFMWTPVLLIVYLMLSLVPSLLLGGTVFAQSPSRPAYILFKKLGETTFTQRWKDEYMGRLDEYGVPGIIFSNGDGTGAVLAGPFTSRESYDAALQKISAHDYADGKAPFFIPARGGEPEPRPDGGRDIPAPRPTAPDTAATVKWMEDAVKESGGVIRCITIEPTGVSSDAFGGGNYSYSFLIYKDGLALGAGNIGTSEQVVYWKEVRSVNMANDGSIDIWTTIHVKSRSDIVGSWYEVSDRPVHLHFWLAATNPQRNGQFVNAVRSLVAASQPH